MKDTSLREYKLLVSFDFLWGMIAATTPCHTTLEPFNRFAYKIITRTKGKRRMRLEDGIFFLCHLCASVLILSICNPMPFLSALGRGNTTSGWRKHDVLC